MLYIIDMFFRQRRLVWIFLKLFGDDIEPKADNSLYAVRNEQGISPLLF
jgi:hypothetical protein